MADGRDERRDEIRRDIIAATKDLIADNGLESLTVQSVMSSVGMSLGSFYNYFASKDELVEVTIAAYTAESDDIRARLVAGEIDSLEAMRQLVRRAVDLMRHDPTRASFMHEALTASSYQQRLLADIELLLPINFAGDELVQRNVPFVAMLLKGAVASAYEYVKENPDVMNREDVFDDAYAILLRVLGLNHPSPKS